MTRLFLNLVNMSVSASWLVLAVFVLRLVLKKAPKWSHVLLWGMVALRLVCPFTIESVVSLIPSAQTLPEQVLYGPSFDVQTGITPVDNNVNEYLGDHYYEGVTVPVKNGLNVMQILAVVWVGGVFLMLSYAVFSYLRLYRKICTAVVFQDNIFQSENISSPFVFGIVKPRIMLPFQLGGENQKYVVSHEQAHIRRKDHWWKPLGFLLLSVYWFHPLMWLSYVFFCRDMELACDEKVIKELGDRQRADYSQALLSCSIRRHSITACPLAFGEVSVKERVKSVLHYKKPGVWMIAAAAVICMAAAVCFLTNPVKQRDTLKWVQELSAQDILSAEFVINPQMSGNRQSMSEEDFPALAALIQQSEGKYLAEHEELNGSSMFFYLMLQDGSTHQIGKIGNTYLVIDGDYYEAKQEWLSTWETEFGEETERSGEEWFSEILPMEFLFASGAGGWSTSLTLYPDGSFEGVYRDGGAAVAPEYPNGTSYYCEFSGRFGEINKISEFAFAMRLEELTYQTEVDKEWIEDEVRYIGSEAYGLAGGEEFILYLPGTPTEGLDEEFLSWSPDNYLIREGSIQTLSSYGLYNVKTGEGFFTSWLQ